MNNIIKIGKDYKLNENVEFSVDFGKIRLLNKKTLDIYYLENFNWIESVKEIFLFKCINDIIKLEKLRLKSAKLFKKLDFKNNYSDNEINKYLLNAVLNGEKND